MEGYLAKIKGRIWLLRGLVLLCAIAIFVLGELSGRGILLDSRTQTEFARSYASFILFGKSLPGFGLSTGTKNFCGTGSRLRSSAAGKWTNAAS